MEYPMWLQVVMGLCMSVGLAGLAGWLLFTSVTKAIREAYRFECKKAFKETEALDNWKVAYEAEHEDHLKDVADLIGENHRLSCENKRMKELLAKVKVKDL